MKNELSSIEKNKTWDLVQLPSLNKKVLPCKWVYKYKYVTGDTTPKFKARLVAKGFKHEYGIDFEEIFLPVVKMTTLRMMIGLVACLDLELSRWMSKLLSCMGI